MVWQLLALQVGFFLLLLLALYQLFHGHLLRAIGRMEKLQQQNFKKEQELQRHQEIVHRDCQAKVKKTEEEMQQIRLRVEEELKVLKQSAQAEIEAGREAGLNEVKEKEKAMQRKLEREAKRQAVTIAFELMKSTFSGSMIRVLHQQLTEELLDSLAQPAPQTINFDGQPVKIKTALPFSDAQREKLKKAVAAWQKKGASSPAIIEEIDENLLAGFMLLIDPIVLDGSLKNRFEKHLKIEM